MDFSAFSEKHAAPVEMTRIGNTEQLLVCHPDWSPVLTGRNRGIYFGNSLK
ncbi:MAG: hypothetical protein ACQEST_01405 [Bacteroidota bacterium]